MIYLKLVIWVSILFLLCGCVASAPEDNSSHRQVDTQIIGLPDETATSEKLTGLRSEGEITLEACTDQNTCNTINYFSFDENRSFSDDFQKNDIFFRLTENHPPYLVLAHSNLSKGEQIENNGGKDDEKYLVFNKNDCISGDLSYGTGVHPIPYLYSKYCWISNDGNFVEFVITDITKIIDEQITYRITIEFVIWWNK